MTQQLAKKIGTPIFRHRHSMNPRIFSTPILGLCDPTHDLPLENWNPTNANVSLYQESFSGEINCGWQDGEEADAHFVHVSAADLKWLSCCVPDLEFDFAKMQSHL